MKDEMVGVCGAQGIDGTQGTCSVQNWVVYRVWVGHKDWLGPTGPGWMAGWLPWLAEA